MGRSSVVSGYPISMGFRRLTVGQRPGFWGITNYLVSKIRRGF